MKISRVVLAVAAVLSFGTVAATASAATQSYDWTLSSGSTAAQGGFTYTGSGLLTVTTGSGGEVIQSLSGTLNGESVTTAPIGTTFDFGVFTADNKVYPAGGNGTSQADGNGIAFETTGGTVLFDLYSQVTPGQAASNEYNEFGAGTTGDLGQGSLSLTPVPLPASAWMLMLGLGGVGFFARRSAKNPGATLAA